MSVTLQDVVRAARQRAVPLSSENAGYLALAVGERAGSSPRRLNALQVELAADASVHLGAGEACAAEEAERDLRQLLASLLEVASSPGPALVRCAAREPGGGLANFNGELEKALIPLNRAAARRALLRLVRETERAVHSGRLHAAEPARSTPPAGPPPVIESVCAASAPEIASTGTRPTNPESIAPTITLIETPYLGPVRAVSATPAVPAAPVGEIAAPSSDEPLTRLEPTIARVRRRRSTPPPLPQASEGIGDTPGMGSVDEYVVSTSERVPVRTPSPPPLPVHTASMRRDTVPSAPPSLSPPPLPVFAWPDATERMPEVMAIDSAEPNEPLEESPALIVGVDVADSDEAAACVGDDELETRPLPPKLGEYQGLPPVKSDVQALLAGFSVASVNESDLRRELKVLAGVDLTPGPPAAEAAPPSVERD